MLRYWKSGNDLDSRFEKHFVAFCVKFVQSFPPETEEIPLIFRSTTDLALK